MAHRTCPDKLLLLYYAHTLKASGSECIGFSCFDILDCALLRDMDSSACDQPNLYKVTPEIQVTDLSQIIILPIPGSRCIMFEYQPEIDPAGFILLCFCFGSSIDALQADLHELFPVLSRPVMSVF